MARIKKFAPKLGRDVFFTHRNLTRKRGVSRIASMPKGVPATTLPVDSTGNGGVSAPMDGNDQYGDCGEAMIAHADNILTYGQGKPGFTESVFDLKALEAQYLAISGGDNGMDESMVVGPSGAWTVGIAGNKAAVCVDALDFDITDAPLTQYLIDQFYAVCLAWSVPDAFVNGFTSGSSWLSAMTPDPANGHYTPLADVSAGGNYRLFTWGGWAWVSPSFVASVQPQAFVGFSPRQFSLATGLDSKGRHITQQAARWQTIGGKVIPANVIQAFPPIGGPTPTPTPTPTPAGPTEAQVQGAVDALFTRRAYVTKSMIDQTIQGVFRPQNAYAVARADWQGVIAEIKAFIVLYGPLAAPLIDGYIATLPISDPEKALLKETADLLLGGKVAV